MSKETIIGDPRKLIEEALKDVEEELRTKLEDVSEGALRILESARIEALKELEEQVSEILTRARDRLRAEEAVLQSRLRMEIAKTRGYWIDRVIEEAQKKFEEYAETETYKEYLRKLLEKAVEQIDSPEIVVEANKRDIPLLEKLASEIDTKGKTIRVSREPVNILGGIRARSPDSRIKIDLSIDLIFDQIASDYRAQIAEALFGGEE
jgi:vacuolar-type H+-ATPase subunit E/Vma4